MMRWLRGIASGLQLVSTSFPAGKSNLAGKEKDAAWCPLGSWGRRYAGRLLGGLILALMLTSFPLASPGGAEEAIVEVLPAAFSDVPTGQHLPVFNYLGALRIMSGDRGLGGPVRPEDPLTRVEFTAVMVRLAGKRDLAGSQINGVPDFEDGPDVPRWAWGMVTVAKDMGLIRGYPDGTFRPYETVTQGEALTMLARLLEWEPAQWGEWDGYVGRAVQGGLAGRLRVDLIERAPAYKHELAHMAQMALSARPTGSRETLFERQFEDVYGVFESSDVSKGTASISGRQYDLAGRVVLAAGRTLDDLRGHPVRAVLGKEGRILYLDPLVGP